MELLIVTGMSGAGKSAVVDALEDLGYFCADNLPPAIIPTIAQFVSKTDNAQKIATVTDIRVGEKMFNEFPNVLKTLEEQGYKYKVLFVDASEEVLGGLGIAILSTNKGVITDKEARKLQVGGEVLAFVW